MGKHSKNNGNSPQGASRPLGRTLRQALDTLEHLGYGPWASDDGMHVRFYHKGNAYALGISGARYSLYKVRGKKFTEVGSIDFESDGHVVVHRMIDAEILPR